jgi:hypothetical protein
MLAMEENKVTEEIVEKAVEAVAEDAGSVVEKAGMSLGTKAGIVGGVLLLGAGTYALVKYIKNKKAKDDVVDSEAEVVETDAVEEESVDTEE